MRRKHSEAHTWLELSDAAQYLGVHFTTLRRWADAGQIACTRTPGGRRRFALRALDAFLQASTTGGPVESGLALFQPMQQAIDHTRQSVRGLDASQPWLSRLDEEQRLRLKGTGQRLMILLLQFNSRAEGGEAFLEEGKRIAREYGLICASVGLSLPETVQVFQFFRRSVLE
jgi:excisionase family DNA binding protein